MSDFYARDSASLGRHQPISLRETLLFEKTQERSESA